MFCQVLYFFFGKDILFFIYTTKMKKIMIFLPDRPERAVFYNLDGRGGEGVTDACCYWEPLKRVTINVGFLSLM
jgi:hypothetical protein